MEKQIELLKMFYRSAQKKIISQIVGGKKYNFDEKKQILRQVDTELLKLQGKTDKWINDNVSKQYLLGGADAKKLLGLADVSINNTFRLIDREAVRAMADDYFLKFADSMTAIKRTSQRLLDTATKQRIQAILADGKITGTTLKTIQNNVAGELKKGVIALIDKSGREWTLEQYAEMLARTKLVEATNTGLHNQLLKNGYDLVQITAHGGCDLCEPYEGEIFSLSGKSDKYPPLDDAIEGGLFHPNCKHRTVPYDEDISEEADKWINDPAKYLGGDFVEGKKSPNK